MAHEQSSIFRLNGYINIQYREKEEIAWLDWDNPGFYISAKTRIQAIDKLRNYILDNINFTALDIKITDTSSENPENGISILKGNKKTIEETLGYRLRNLGAITQI